MLLNDEQRQKVLENEKLVYYLVGRMGFYQGMPEYDDYASEGKIGLIKAVKTYDESKNTKFATYASRCITNEILMYMRKNKKQVGALSLEEPTAENLTIGDMIEDPDAEFTVKFEELEDFSEVIYYILNYLNPKMKYCILLKMGGKTQREIGKILSISQSYVSRLVLKIVKDLKVAINENYEVKEYFRIKTIEDSCYIVFSSKDVENIRILFLKLLEDVSIIIPDFKWYIKNEQFTVEMLADKETYVFLTRFMMEMDKFQIRLTSKDSVNNV